MPPNLGQFIKLADAPKTYEVSITTLRRRREQARSRPDPENIFSNFIVRTRDGDIFEQPSKEKVNELTHSGKMPEWFVNHLWLQQEFGPSSPTHQTDTGDPHEQLADSPSSTPGEHPEQPEKKPLITLTPDQNDSTALRIALAQVSDLQRRLDDSEKRNRELLEYGQKDKELFANATENLTRLLPSLARQTPPPQRPAKQGSDASTKPPSATAKKAPKAKRAGFFGWLR